MHDRQGEYLPEGVTCILDLLHVMEKLWKVAWCLFEEATQKTEAERWVEDRLRMLLDGKVGSCHRWPASNADEAEAPRDTPQDRAGGDRLLRSEPQSDAVRRRTWRRATRSVAA